MAQNQILTVSLSPQLAERVREKVRAGEYASESQLIEDSLESFLEPHNEFEAWIKTEVLPTIERINNGTTALVPADKAWSKIEGHIAMRRKQAGE